MREQTKDQTRTGHESAKAQGAPAISRRQLLAGAGALGASALLAGAGSLAGVDGAPLSVPQASANPKSGSNGPLNCRVYTMYANQKLTTTRGGSKAAVTLSKAGKRMRVIDSDGDYFKVNAARPATPAHVRPHPGFGRLGGCVLKVRFPHVAARARSGMLPANMPVETFGRGRLRGAEGAKNSQAKRPNADGTPESRNGADEATP